MPDKKQSAESTQPNFTVKKKMPVLQLEEDEVPIFSDSETLDSPPELQSQRVHLTPEQRTERHLLRNATWGRDAENVPSDARKRMAEYIAELASPRQKEVKLVARSLGSALTAGGCYLIEEVTVKEEVNRYSDAQTIEPTPYYRLKADDGSVYLVYSNWYMRKLALRYPDSPEGLKGAILRYNGQSINSSGYLAHNVDILF